MLKVNDRAGFSLVETDEGRKGYLWNDEMFKVVHPPRDTGSVKGCPQPSLFRGDRPPVNILRYPSPEDLEDLEVDQVPPGDAADSGTGRPR